MSNIRADLNLLFAVLALQNDLVAKDDLLAGMHAWGREKHRLLADILCELGAMSADDRRLIDPLVERYVRTHGSAQACLSKLDVSNQTKNVLAAANDTDVQATLASLTWSGVQSDSDAEATQPFHSTPTHGRYRVLRPHAKGGLGEVFIAQDLELNRNVALKEIQQQYTRHESSRRRFLLEAEVTGGLEHPGIVPVYGLGAYEDGRPFYAMRFIKGENLSEAIDRFHVTTWKSAGERNVAFRQLLRRFVDVCNAIGFAHSRGVLHRDLKPANIMLGPYGETLVVDWGMAKALGRRDVQEDSALEEPTFFPTTGASLEPTQDGLVFGTPTYMSPEQAAGKRDEVGPASDTYSLGAILYTLLVGRPPFQGPMDKVLAQVKLGTFTPPRQVQTSLPAALDAICRKAMARQAKDRYSTAVELADEIEKWLADEPVRAYREPTPARAGRWMRRHRSVVAGLGALVLSATVATGIASYVVSISQTKAAAAKQAEITAQGEKARSDKLRDEAQTAQAKALSEKATADKLRDSAQAAQAKAINEKAAADKARSEAEYQEYIAVVGMAKSKLEENAHGRAKLLLEKYRDRPDLINWEWGRLMRLCNQSVANYVSKDGDRIEAVAFDSRGERFVAGGWNGRAYVWKVKQGDPLAIKTGGSRVTAVAFSPTQDVVATGSDLASGYLRLWNATTGAVVGKENAFAGHAGPVLSVLFTKDGKRLLSSSADGTARLWNVETGALIRKYMGHVEPVNAVAFSPREDRIVTVSDDGTALVWNVETGAKSPPFHGHEGPVYTVTFSPDGTRIVTGGYDNRVLMWDPAELRPFDYKRHIEEYSRKLMEAKAFQVHGTTGITCTGARPGSVVLVRVYDPATGEEREYANLNPELVHELYLCGLLTNFCRTLPNDEYEFYLKEGRRAAVLILKLRVLNGRLVPPITLSSAIAADPTSSSRVFRKSFVEEAALPEEIADWQYVTQVGSETLEGGLLKFKVPLSQKVAVLAGHTGRVTSVRFSVDGKILFSAGHDNVVHVWDANRAWTDGPKSLVKTLRGHDSPVRGCAVTNDGGQVLTGSYDGTAKLWNVRKYEEVRVLMGTGPRHSDEILSASFARQGDQLRIITASQDRTAKIWRLDGAERDSLIDEKRFVEEKTLVEGHEFLASTAVFLDGGKKLITCGVDQSAYIWDVSTGTELRKLSGTGGNAVVAVSPDGKWILTGANRHAAQLWSAANNDPPIVLEGHNGPITAVAFSPDGKTMYTGDNVGTGRLWNADSRQPIGSPLKGIDAHLGEIAGAVFLPEGKGLLTASADNHVGYWDLTASPVARVAKRTLIHPKGVVSLAVTNDGRYALTSCEDNQVRLWDVATAKELRRFSIASREKEGLAVLGSVAFSHDNQRGIFVVDEDRSVRVFLADPTSREPAKMLLALENADVYLRSAIFTPDDSAVLTVGGNEARLWDAKVRQEGERASERMRFSPHSEVASARFSPDGKRVVTAGWDFTARIWNAETGRDELKLKGHTLHVNCAHFSPDGRLVLTASDDKTARLWDANTGRPLVIFGGHGGGVRWAAFSNKGDRVLTASADSVVRLWDATMKIPLENEPPTVLDKPLGELRGHAAAVLSVGFSDDDARIVTGSRDNTARVWDAKTMKLLQTLSGHTGGVNSVRFSPDGKRVLTGSDDLTAKIWDLEKGQELLTLSGHKREITAVDFSADGSHALTASRDGNVIVWTADDWKARVEPAKEAAAQLERGKSRK